MESKIFAISLICFCSCLFSESLATCYFPDYLQGEYLMQSSVTLQSPSQVQYTTVSVTSEAISPWGFCEKKIGNDMYLTQNINNKSLCLRCFHISVKSPNILIARTAGNPERCFLSEVSAEASCPKAEFLDSGWQMILYKTAKEIKKEQCPINGIYSFLYKQQKGEQSVECSGRSSHINNCPIGSELNIHFRDCPFENHEIVFECLGSWNGPNNQKYLALFDTRPGEDPRPQYRCGLYQEDPVNGNVYVAFSSDSTCLNDLRSSKSGFETLVLAPQSNLQSSITERNTCRFPNWLQGQWELVTVNGKSFTYVDTMHYKMYTFNCLNYDELERRYDFPISIDEEKKIFVQGKTHCGDEMYSCMWIKRRGPNVFEFQLGTQTSLQYNSSLCSSFNFQPHVWITQGRKDYLEESPCPILGEYVGILPDTEDRLCAKLSSDCQTPDTMYYTVSDCSTQVYEEKRRRTRHTTNENNPSLSVQMEKTVTANASNETSTIAPNVTTATVPVSTVSKITHSTEIISTTPKLNDSVAEESNTLIASDIILNVNPTESSSVGSYYIENHNLPGVVLEDGRYDVSAKTVLPPLVSSSIMPPPYRRNYVPSAPPSYPNPAFERPYLDYPFYNRADTFPVNYPTYSSGYYQSQEQYRNAYYQGWNHSRVPPDYQNGQIHITDPHAFERRTVIALPPVQLHSIPTRRTMSYRKFKDREYQCLGQWQENGLTYTFTQRKHVGNYECFVGSMISESEFSVREAGKHCERNGNSMLGMILKKTRSCVENRTSSTYGSFSPNTPAISVPVTTTRPTTKRFPATTKPFRSNTNATRPQSPYKNKNSNTNDSIKNVPSFLFLISICSLFFMR